MKDIPMRKLSTLLITLSSALIVACSAPSEEAGTAQDTSAQPAAGERVVNIYSTRHYDSDRLLYKAFEDKTGIRVRAREGNSTGLLEAMKAEGASSPADLVLATDAGTLWRFQSEGLLQPASSATLDAAIPAKYREPSGHWFGLSRRARVIVFDPNRYTADQLTDYSDLASDTFKDDVCMRSSSNIYNLSLMGELIARWGEDKAGDWASAVTGNFARQPTGGDTTQIESIAAGECGVALINHYYWARLKASNSAKQRASAEATQLRFPAGENGTHVNITGAGLAAHASNTDNAIAFMEFLISPEGQAMLITETKEFPMIDGVPLPSGLETLPEFETSDVSLTLFGENQIKAQTLYDRAGWK